MANLFESMLEANFVTNLGEEYLKKIMQEYNALIAREMYSYIDLLIGDVLNSLKDDMVGGGYDSKEKAIQAFLGKNDSNLDTTAQDFSIQFVKEWKQSLKNKVIKEVLIKFDLGSTIKNKGLENLLSDEDLSKYLLQMFIDTYKREMRAALEKWINK